jgi:predicted PurR-regulated permease PerM
MERIRRISTERAFAILVIVGIFLYLIRPILLPFVLSGAIAYAAEPAVERLSRRLGSRRWVAAALVFVALASILTGAGLLALPDLIANVAGIVGNFQEIVQRILAALFGTGAIEFLGHSTTAAELAAEMTRSARDWLVGSSQALTLAAFGSVAIFGLFLFLALLLYFLVTGPQIGAGLLWLVPPQQRPLVRHLAASVAPVLRRYFVGLAAIVCYASVAAYLGLGLALHLPGAAVLAVMTGLLELIPMVGPATSAVLAGLIAIQAAKGIGPIIGYAIYATLLRISIDQFIGPLLLGRAAYLHPVLIIFCFLAGGYLFGMVGLLLAVPVALTIRIVLYELYEGIPFEPDEEQRR